MIGVDVLGLFNFSRRANPHPKGAAGHRAYAVGDIHGRLDLLDQLLGQIERDLSARPRRKTLIVFLGDYIDRGPHSAQVIERLRTYRPPNVTTMFLLGNHEEVLLRILAGDASLIASWLSFGGAECLQSYGVRPASLSDRNDQEILEIIRKVIPEAHHQFLRDCIDSCRFGDYLFVHAGIRPGVLLDQQSQADLRWIREPFLRDTSDYGFVVVHGHTITTKVETRPNRIGIDTGAYRTGVLTALGLEDEHRWRLATGQGPARVAAQR